MRWRAGAILAIGAATLAGAACGLTAVGTREVVEAGAPEDAFASEEGPANGGDAGAGDGGGDGAGGDAGAPCVLADGGGPGVDCGGTCVDPAIDRANCGGCGKACSPWAACEGNCVDVAANLVGIRHEIPCTNDASPACANGSSPQDEVVALTGTSGKTYAITARFRGVLEQRTYTGDTPGTATGENASFWTTGGTSSGTDNWNIYDVIVSAPTITWHLNSGVSGNTFCDRIDYVATFQATAGATITVHADSMDLAQARNRSSADAFILVPGIPPYPAAYYGQFVQIDVVSVR